MKNNFQIIVLSIFGFFILLGLVTFSVYKANNSKTASVTVSIWGTVDDSSFKSFISSIKQNLNKDVNVAYTQKDISTFDTDLVNAIASGKGPDVMLLPENLIVRYSDKVYPIPFATLPQRTFANTFIEEGNLYLNSSGVMALPFFVDPLVMYWNTDTFSGAGIATPPTKWSEIPLLAGKLSKSDNNANILQSTVAFGGFDNINNAKEIISALIIQTGNSIVGTNSGGLLKSTLSDFANSSSDTLSPVEQALNFYTSYSDPTKSVYSWNSSLPEDKQMFLSGDLAIYFGKASELADIRAKNPNLNFDVAMLPQIVDTKVNATYGDIQGFAILNSSKNIAGAYTAISTLIGSDTEPLFLQVTGYAPARRDIISAGTSDPAQTVFYNSALISKGWLDPDSAKTNQIFQSMINDMTTGRAKTSDAIQNASQKIDNLL
jgi:multiple sugar transport system substrate-binding protein